MNKTSKIIIGTIFVIGVIALLIMYDGFRRDSTPKYYQISDMELEAVQRQAFEEGKYVGRSAVATYFYEYLTDSVKCALCNDTSNPIVLQLDRVLEIEAEYTEELKKQQHDD